MQVTATTASTASATAAASSTNSSSSILGKDDFLKLLCAQLQNQDPQNAVDTTQWMSQLYQLTSLESQENLTSDFESFSSSQSLVGATALIGKTITYTDATSNSQLTGVVESAKTTNGTTSVTVNGTDVALTDIVAVAPTSTE